MAIIGTLQPIHPYDRLKATQYVSRGLATRIFNEYNLGFGGCPELPKDTVLAMATDMINEEPDPVYIFSEFLQLWVRKDDVLEDVYEHYVSTYHRRTQSQSSNETKEFTPSFWTKLKNFFF